MNLRDLLSSRYDTESFESFLRERFYGLDIYDNAHTDDDLSESERKSIDSYRFLGKAELDDGREIGFFEFRSRTSHIENKRVGYNAVLKKLAGDEILDGAIAAFYHPDSHAWRLSFVGFEYDEGRAKVTNLKRYTYVLGEGIPVKTPLAQLAKLKYPGLDEIEEAFSVEAVSRAFYTEYKKLFEKITEEVLPQKALFRSEEPEVEARSFARRLLGRITFLYFLQKKGWLGVQQSWGDGDRNFLQKIYQNDPVDFYERTLKPLFFTAMNTPREGDYYVPLACRIPFLNGGLFALEAFDTADVMLSDAIFGEIFETFNQYNFTIIEDLPHDSEVAIDPEMLGRVFENLIEENYRKGKGAFYTPREIVHYMSRQSIILYLGNHFDREPIEKLVNDEVTDDPYIKRHAGQIRDKLLQMKVLDPAIGSGAFPMGVLHEMVQIIGNLNKADNTSREKKQIIENSIYGVDIDGSAVDIAKLRFWLSIIVEVEEPFPLPNLAFKIMQGNSLIETIDGFLPIPDDLYTRTEAKQLSLFEEEHTFFDRTKFERLRDNIHAFYNASDPRRKEALQETIKEEVKEIILGYIDASEKELRREEDNLQRGKNVSDQKKFYERIEKLYQRIAKARKIINEMLANNFQTTELFLYKLWFGEVMKEGGFDVVIGNPPYVQLQTAINSSEKLADLYKDLGYKTFERRGDIYALFYEKGIELLRDRGTLCYITSNKWMKTAYGKSLRGLLVRYNVNELIDLGPDIFESATVETNILILEKTEPENPYIPVKVLKTKRDIKYLDDEEYLHLDHPSEDAWIILSPVEESIKKKIDALGKPLKEWDLKINFGIKTGYNTAFVIDGKTKDELITSDPESAEVIKPLLRGKDIGKFSCALADKWLIVAKYGSHKYLENQYPTIYKHLLKHKNNLSKRGQCTNKGGQGQHHWLELDNNPTDNYLQQFEKEKIVWKRIGSKIRFGYSDKGEYCLDSTVIATGEYIKYLTALLNSKLIVRELMLNAPKTGTGDVIISVQALTPLKIHYPDKQTAKPFEDIVDQIIQYKKQGKPTKELEERIDQMVYELYGLTQDEISVIEGHV